MNLEFKEMPILTVPPQPFPDIARHELTQLRNELAASRREVADLTTSVDLLWEQIANLRAAVHRLEHATGTMEHCGLAVTSEVAK